MVELVGGPFDGAQLSSKPRLPFVWTDGSRCFKAAARGRSLYRNMTGERNAVSLVVKDGKPGLLTTRFRFIGNTHAVCDCGTLRKKHVKCAICGEIPVTTG